MLCAGYWYELLEEFLCVLHSVCSNSTSESRHAACYYQPACLCCLSRVVGIALEPDRYRMPHGTSELLIPDWRLKRGTRGPLLSPRSKLHGSVNAPVCSTFPTVVKGFCPWNTRCRGAIRATHHARLWLWSANLLLFFSEFGGSFAKEVHRRVTKRAIKSSNGISSNGISSNEVRPTIPILSLLTNALLPRMKMIISVSDLLPPALIGADTSG